MNAANNNTSLSAEPQLWLRAATVTFIIGVVCGGALTPIVHGVVYQQSDPFAHGWPFCLHVSAFLSSLIIAIWLRCTATVALGIYVGLVGWMVASGQAEYPLSSAIGLLIHGFIPGALGSAIAFVVLWARGRFP